MSVELVKRLPDLASGVLVKAGDDYYIVSSIEAYSGPETLVFPANDRGEVSEWLHVAGGRGMDREQAIADLERTLA